MVNSTFGADLGTSAHQRPTFVHKAPQVEPQVAQNVPGPVQATLHLTLNCAPTSSAVPTAHCK